MAETLGTKITSGRVNSDRPEGEDIGPSRVTGEELPGASPAGVNRETSANLQLFANSDETLLPSSTRTRSESAINEREHPLVSNWLSGLPRETQSDTRIDYSLRDLPQSQQLPHTFDISTGLLSTVPPTPKNSYDTRTSAEPASGIGGDGTESITNDVQVAAELRTACQLLVENGESSDQMRLALDVPDGQNGNSLHHEQQLPEVPDQPQGQLWDFEQLLPGLPVVHEEQTPPNEENLQSEQGHGSHQGADNDDQISFVNALAMPRPSGQSFVVSSDDSNEIRRGRRFTHIFRGLFRRNRRQAVAVGNTRSGPASPVLDAMLNSPLLAETTPVPRRRAATLMRAARQFLRTPFGFRRRSHTL